ncbi:MAG: ABC transporter permease subunit [Clostridia bacterium]|nr:ABC transporter permease subunit [Clostridia bacterium]
MTVSGTRSKHPRLRRVLLTVCALVFWIALWAILAAWVDKEVLLPSPVSVGRVLVELILLPSYWVAIGASLLRILVGFLIGCAVGIVLAVLCFRFAVADALISPALSVIRAVPVASFIILALVLIGTGAVPSFTAFLMVLPIVAANTKTGIASADPGLREVCRLYRFGILKTVRLLYIPSIRPYFLTAARTSLGLAWKAGIAAEVLCSSLPRSIGGEIYDSKVYLEMPALFAWTITVILISMGIESLLFRLPVFKESQRTAKEGES